MKYLMTTILAGVFILLILPSNAQKFSSDKPITIENLSADNVWQIVEMTLKEKGFGLGKFTPEENKLYSAWIEWTSVAIKNRGILLFTYQSPNLTLQMADRGYQTSKGWEEAIGNLSKKNYADYIQSVADRIIEINGNAADTKKAVLNSELIHAFKPVNTIGEITLTLIKTSHENLKPILEFSVKNNATYPVTIALPVATFFQNAAGGANSYVGTKWSHPAEKPNAAVIQPGESTGLTIDYGYDWKLTNVPRFDLRIIGTNVEGKWTELKMYQIPLKDFVYKPDEQ